MSIVLLIYFFLERPEWFLSQSAYLQQIQFIENTKATLDMIQQSKLIHSYDIVKHVFEQTHAKIKHPISFICDQDGEIIIRDDVRLKKVYSNLYCTIPIESGNKKEPASIQAVNLPFASASNICSYVQSNPMAYVCSSPAKSEWARVVGIIIAHSAQPQFAQSVQ
jgi:hypothetical protein